MQEVKGSSPLPPHHVSERRIVQRAQPHRMGSPPNNGVVESFR